MPAAPISSTDFPLDARPNEVQAPKQQLRPTLTRAASR
jgi:hypothetical protein